MVNWTHRRWSSSAQACTATVRAKGKENACRPGSPGSSACGHPYKSPGMSWQAWPCPFPLLYSQLWCSRCSHWMSRRSPFARGSHCYHGYHNRWSQCCGPAEERKAVTTLTNHTIDVWKQCMCVWMYLKQQPVDLFTNLLDVWIHDLPSVKRRRCENIFIDRTPKKHTHTRTVVI